MYIYQAAKMHSELLLRSKCNGKRSKIYETLIAKGWSHKDAANAAYRLSKGNRRTK